MNNKKYFTTKSLKAAQAAFTFGSVDCFCNKCGKIHSSDEWPWTCALKRIPMYYLALTPGRYIVAVIALALRYSKGAIFRQEKYDYLWIAFKLSLTAPYWFLVFWYRRIKFFRKDKEEEKIDA